MGQQVRLVDKAGNGFIVPLTPQLLVNISLYSYEICQLILRDLESMFHDEAFELCKLIDSNAFGDFRFSKWSCQRHKKEDKHWKAYSVTNPKATHTFEIDLIDGLVNLYERDENKPEVCGELVPNTCSTYWQWYLQKGFAIPMHPDGENLIQMGLAMDAIEMDGPKQ